MKLHLVFIVTLAAINFSTFAKSAIVNIDFNGQRANDLSSAGTFVGQGVAGGGLVFNGLAVVSATFGGTNIDNLTVSGTNLLNDTGLVTPVGFSISTVGGDSNPDVTPGNPAPLPGVSDALFRDYLYTPGASNTLQFTGLVPNSTVDVYAYVQFLQGYSFPTGTFTAFAPTAPFTDFLSGGNTLLWAGITVSPTGTITADTGGVNVFSGFTIVGPGVITVPEPATLALFAVGCLCAFAARRRSS